MYTYMSEYTDFYRFFTIIYVIILWYTYTYTSEYFIYTKYNYMYMCDSNFIVWIE